MGVDGTLGGFHVAADQGFGERATAGGAAGAAIGVREHLLHFVDAGVFEDPELAIGDREGAGKQYAQPPHEEDGEGHVQDVGTVHDCTSRIAVESADP